MGEVGAAYAGCRDPAFEGLLDSIGDPGRQAVADVVTHEHDIRAALDQPGARDSDGVAIGLGFVAPLFVRDAVAPLAVTVRIEAAGGVTYGEPGADLVLRAEPFDVLRALTGRRTVEQIRAMDWSGDVERVLPAFTFGPFRPAVEFVEVAENAR